MRNTTTRDDLESGHLLFTPDTAAAILSISRGQLYREMRAGRLHGLVIGARTRRFSRAELENFIRGREALSL